MLPKTKTFMTWCLIGGLTMLPSGIFAATAASPQVKKSASAEAMTVDFALARPLGLVSTVCGSAIFLVSSPFSAIGGNSQEAWNELVAKPAKFTFARPLGQFDEEKK